MRENIFTEDPYQMSWLRSDYTYAEVSCSRELVSQVSYF